MASKNLPNASSREKTTLRAIQRSMEMSIYRGKNSFKLVTCLLYQADGLFSKVMRIREDTAAITWRMYVESTVRKVDFARRAGKRLPAEVEAHKRGRR